jgi:hypothetical protein
MTQEEIRDQVLLPLLRQASVADVIGALASAVADIAENVVLQHQAGQDRNAINYQAWLRFSTELANLEPSAKLPPYGHYH